MVEYKPWSLAIVKEMAQEAIYGNFTCLDIEVGDKCPYNCIYCETPTQNRNSKVDIDKVCALLDTKQFKWVYICGIGEPTYSDNEKQLLRILKYCKKNGVGCSIFTNLSNLSEKIIEYIKEGVLYCIFKFDSQLAGIVDKLYNPINIKEHLANVEKMITLVQCDGKTTNLAASIVPTKYNIDEIPRLVQWCIENNIFPLVAQLEYTGAAKDVYEQLVLDDEILCDLKRKIAKIIGGEYHVPFCPAIFSGFSITYDNKIAVDRRTGLSCHSFWLDDPELDIVCDNFSDMAVYDIADKIIGVRVEHYNHFLKKPELRRYDVLGGCGGNRKDIFDLYEEMMKTSFELQEPDNYNLKVNRFVYLDNNATTQISESVREAMEPYLGKCYANPNSNSQLGRSVKAAVDKARGQVARALGSRKGDKIYFTSCGSESNSWAIKSCLDNEARAGKHIILSTEIEHESVLRCLSEIDKSRYEIINIPITKNGEADIDSFLGAFSQWEDVCFATVMLVNNETGIINDIGRLAGILHEKQIPLHCDAVQGFGKMRINVNDLNVDYLSVSGHKIHAPKGIGALFVKGGSHICPLIYGTQENGMRGGTENAAYIVAFGQAAEDAYSNQDTPYEERIDRMEEYRKRIEDAFLNSDYKVIINGRLARRVANTVNMGFEDVDALKLSLLLESRGIYVSNSAACNTTNPQESHVLKAMKSPAHDNGAIRVSLSEYTQERDIDYFIDNLKESIKKIKGG